MLFLVTVFLSAEVHLGLTILSMVFHLVVVYTLLTEFALRLYRCEFSSLKRRRIPINVLDGRAGLIETFITAIQLIDIRAVATHHRCARQAPEWIFLRYQFTSQTPQFRLYICNHKLLYIFVLILTKLVLLRKPLFSFFFRQVRE